MRQDVSKKPDAVETPLWAAIGRLQFNKQGLF
jgi:hypothetical protein